MNTREPGGIGFWLVLCAAFTGFCAFYAPQPLLPAFSTAYGVPATTSAWLLTAPFLALACGPILVGAILQRVSARKLLSVSMAILGIALLGFANAESFVHLMVFRVIQSILLAIIFTTCITYASNAGDSSQRPKRVALYVSTTIFGGFSGRLISGFVADEFGLEAPFILFGILALISAGCIWTQVKDTRLPGEVLSLRSILGLFKKKDIRVGLIIVFTTFFAFSSALTAMPFRLVELNPGIQSSNIALVYSGYAIGIFIPIIIAWLVARGRKEVDILKIGTGIFLMGFCGLLIPDTAVLMFVFVLLAAGMFTIHATAAGLLNKLQSEHASVINGAYISNYYSAAAIGSVVPLWLIESVGWNAYVGATAMMIAGVFWLIRVLGRE
ncbi:MFS transporter [Granulosicoccus sp.]|nr:MFS transporter [Granulosicoccus sp.]MDB4222957.1 MFS transporter [Granulosicoccus sp.]